MKEIRQIIIKIKTNLKNPLENYENHKIHTNSFEKNENHENRRNPFENHKNHVKQ